MKQQRSILLPMLTTDPFIHNASHAGLSYSPENHTNGSGTIGVARTEYVAHTHNGGVPR